MSDNQKKKNCFWPWRHQWGKWEIYNQGILVKATGQKIVQEAQKRRCENCGLEQRKDFSQ